MKRREFLTGLLLTVTPAATPKKRGRPYRKAWRMKTLFVVISFALCSTAFAQMPPISCEGWMEVHNQTGKLATEIRTWIVSEMRRRGFNRASVVLDRIETVVHQRRWA